MPIYEYACEKCDHEFEVEQRITDDPVKSCPQCRGRKVKKLISRTSFVLKGGGWYSDLYSSPEGKKKDKDKGGSEDTSDDKPEKKKSGGDDKDKGGKSKGKKGKSKKAAA